MRVGCWMMDLSSVPNDECGFDDAIYTRNMTFNKLNSFCSFCFVFFFFSFAFELYYFFSAINLWTKITSLLKMEFCLLNYARNVCHFIVKNWKMEQWHFKETEKRKETKWYMRKLFQSFFSFSVGILFRGAVGKCRTVVVGGVGVGIVWLERSKIRLNFLVKLSRTEQAKNNNNAKS